MLPSARPPLACRLTPRAAAYHNGIDNSCRRRICNRKLAARDILFPRPAQRHGRFRSCRSRPAFIHSSSGCERTVRLAARDRLTVRALLVSNPFSFQPNPDRSQGRFGREEAQPAAEKQSSSRTWFVSRREFSRLFGCRSIVRDFVAQVDTALSFRRSCANGPGCAAAGPVIVGCH
jgi:hypothetical protein